MEHSARGVSCLSTTENDRPLSETATPARGLSWPAPLENADLSDALRLTSDERVDLRSEDVALTAAVGRVLAEDVYAAVDLPGARVSAMDGFAVRASDGTRPLRVALESAAGVPATGAVVAGTAARISTGAVLPDGADAVARAEVVQVEGDVIHLRAPVDPGRDVRERGEALAAGTKLLSRETRVEAQHIGALGAAGLAVVSCVTPPWVTILSTGAELRPLGGRLAPGEAYDSNRHGLAAQVRAAGARVITSSATGDDRAETAQAIRTFLDGEDGAAPDLLIVSGGISRGVHDHVRSALADAGVKPLLSGIAASPCRPTVLGRRGDQLVLALPGNPVAAAVGFHVLGRPLLGLVDRWERRSSLAVDWPLRLDRAQLLRCTHGPRGLVPVRHQGSGAVASLLDAQVVAWMPAGIGRLDAGEPVAYSALR